MKQMDCIRETEIKKELGDVLYLINWMGMSRIYFGKSTAWLYHKLDGVDGFTDEEMQKLKDSFKDLASKLNTLADTLKIEDYIK